MLWPLFRVHKNPLFAGGSGKEGICSSQSRLQVMAYVMGVLIIPFIEDIDGGMFF